MIIIRNSQNWKHWVAIRDNKICILCKEKHGTIYAINEVVNPSPPLHFRCRCRIERLKSLFAGEATTRGTDGADWHLKYNAKLPGYYLSRNDASKLGWNPRKNSLDMVAKNHMIFGGQYFNKNGHLPSEKGRVWYEADINYVSGKRNSERLLFSNDGLMFVTYDHYATFVEVR